MVPQVLTRGSFSVYLAPLAVYFARFASYTALDYDSWWDHYTLQSNVPAFGL